jgi:hypothetical protein
MLINDFPNNYEIIVNPELPGTGKWGVPEVYIPQGFKPKTLGGHLILRINVDQKWQVWHVDSDENSEVWTAPDPDRILIAGIEGALYVSLKDPSDIIKFKLYSLNVTSVKEHGVLLLNDYFRVMALDSSGIRWQTSELVEDDMTIKAIDGDRVICSGFSLSNIDEEVKIVLDISTGAVLKDTTRPPKKSPLQRFRTRLSLFRRGKSSPKPDSACEVCGFYTFFSDERGRYLICPVCFWEDDEFHKDPDEPCDGPNHGVSLNQARKNYHKFGASRKEDVPHVRKPRPEEIPS